MMTNAQGDIRDIQKELDAVLTGGNHLASILIGHLGAGEETFPSYKASPGHVGDVLDGDVWDTWVAWRAIMLLRDKLKDLGVYE